MFFKRVKRSQKWIHEGQGTKQADSNTSISSSLTPDEEVEKLKRHLKLEMMPNLKLILDPREILSLDKLKKTGDIVEHNVVSPDVCHSLVKDLNSPEINKGAAIFLKRKEKSQDWIVDENSTVIKIREQKREQELKKQAEDNVQKEWLIKKQKEQDDFKSISNVLSNQPKTLYIQSKKPLEQRTTSLIKKSDTKLEDNQFVSVSSLLLNQFEMHFIYYFPILEKQSTI